jgi:2-polyprenyl-3-methyl-5-hydroxy-6-metoxy-1,4-benzoquinol methylase
LIYIKPFPTNEQIEKHYKKKAIMGNYATLTNNISAYKEVYLQYLRLLRSYYGSLKEKTLLDVGCYSGDFLDLAKKEGAITYGIELQSEACSIANSKHQGRILNTVVDEADFSIQFDIIIATGFIEHIPNPLGFMKKVKKWLKNDGILLIETPNAGSFIAKLLGKKWPPYQPIEHLYYFSKKNIKKFLNNCDLNILSLKPHIKMLPLHYVYEMMNDFGDELKQLVMPFYSVLPNSIRRAVFPFYVGEMIIIAKKRCER